MNCWQNIIWFLWYSRIWLVQLLQREAQQVQFQKGKWFYGYTALPQQSLISNPSGCFSVIGIIGEEGYCLNQIQSGACRRSYYFAWIRKGYFSEDSYSCFYSTLLSSFQPTLYETNYLLQQFQSLQTSTLNFYCQFYGGFSQILKGSYPFCLSFPSISCSPSFFLRLFNNLVATLRSFSSLYLLFLAIRALNLFFIVCSVLLFPSNPTSLDHFFPVFSTTFQNMSKSYQSVQFPLTLVKSRWLSQRSRQLLGERKTFFQVLIKICLETSFHFIPSALE